MRTWRTVFTAVVFVCSGGALGGCSGGGTGAPTPPSARTPSAAIARVTFTLNIPSRSEQRRRRRPDYVSAATNSVTISVTPAGGSGAGGAAAPPVTMNCSSGETCSTTIGAPIGSDTFLVRTYAQAGGAGAVLGIGSATQNVDRDAANTIDVTLDGVVDSVALTLASPASIPAGTAATEMVLVAALDAAGDTIVAPGGYVNVEGEPVTISVTKNDVGNGKGATAFVGGSSGPVATVSGTILPYAYNGSDIDATTFASTTSQTIAGSQGSATVGYVPTYITKYADGSSTDTNFITTGPDGNLWFTDFSSGEVGSIVPGSGAIVHYEIPSTLLNGGAEPEAIVAGPNATMYFAEFNSNAIGSISTTAAATFGASTPILETDLLTLNANPRGIAYDTTCSPNIWFTEFNGDKIGALSPTTMTVTEYSVPTAAAQPDQIACGPDGNFWFTEFAGNKIGTITSAGAVTEYPLPNASAPHGPIGIVAGGDGSMWFTESTGNMVSRIATSKSIPAGTAAGTIVEYPLASAAPNPYGSSLAPAIIAASPDGDLFFSEVNSATTTSNAAIGRITTAASVVPGSIPGVATQYPLSPSSNMPFGVTLGPDGHIWFTEMGSQSIGYVIY